MFYRHKPSGLHKSKLIAFINFLENFAQAIMVVVLPLYLFAIFQSELIIGKVASMGTAAGIITILFLGFILSKFPRHTVYKISIGVCFVSIVILFALSSMIEAYSSRLLLTAGAVTTAAVLALYLRDLTPHEELSKMEGLYYSLIGLAWVLGPATAGWLITFFGAHQQTLVISFPFLHLLDQSYFQYVAPFIISLILYLIVLMLFVYGKFILKHKHLQESTHSKKHDDIYHHKHFKNWFEYFKNDNRTLSFINIAFMGIWWSFIFTYFSLLLSRHNIPEQTIGVLLGLMSLPLVLFENFINKAIKIFNGSLNTLIVGYSIFFLLVITAFIIGTESIYLFSAILIASIAGVALAEPLQGLMYFEGTDESNEGKFYSINQIGGQITRFITPMLAGFLIGIFGVDTTFSFFPFLFIPLFIVLFYFKKNTRNS